MLEYWLNDYGTCPDLTWTQSGSDCWKNSEAVPAPFVPIAVVMNESIGLVGQVISGGADSVFLETNEAAYALAEPDNVLGLGESAGWNTVEFNVFGEGGGSQAVFNDDATIDVKILMSTVDQRTGAPRCSTDNLITVETNSLTVVEGSCCAKGGSPPRIEFLETNTATGVVPPFCLLNALAPLLRASTML